MTTLAHNGDLYRVVVATTASNLADPNCRFTQIGNIIGLQVIDCGDPLTTLLLSFSGQVNNEHAILNWTTSKEEEPLYFDIEKSYNGVDYSTIVTVNSHVDYSADLNVYSYTDLSVITGKIYYRIKMRGNGGSAKYSRTVQVSLYPVGISFVTVINPFSDQLVFDVSSGKSNRATVEIIDPLGKILKRKPVELAPGLNSLMIENTGVLPPGIYILRLQTSEEVIQKMVMKQR
jgi:hypothetical protein